MDQRVETVLARLEERSRSEIPRLLQLRAAGKTALRDVASEFMLDVGRDVGRMLNLMVRAAGATTVVEVGGSVGYSTIWLAEAVPRDSGRVISFEPDDGKRVQQRQNLEDAGLLPVVELVGDDAGSVLPELPGPFDLVFLDHWKELYKREFDLVWPKLRPGGLVIADNIIKPAKNAAIIADYLAHVRQVADARTLVVDIGDGISLTVRE